MPNLNSNFWSGGKFYMVRCPKCSMENWMPMVAEGQCAWCGYKEEGKDGKDKGKRDSKVKRLRRD